MAFHTQFHSIMMKPSTSLGSCFRRAADKQIGQRRSKALKSKTRNKAARKISEQRMKLNERGGPTAESQKDS